MMRLLKDLRAWLGVAALALSVIAPTSALAWGPHGHAVIMEVAYARLRAQDSALADRFDAIFTAGGGLNFSYKHVKTGKPGKCRAVGPDDRAALVNWADCARYSARYAPTADNHFDDIRNCTATPPMPALSTYCDNGRCGSEVLKEYVRQLQLPKDKISDRNRAIALAYIVHIVGDLHQPMHATDNDDAGGNGVEIKIDPVLIPATNPKYPPENLHSLFDTPLVKEAIGTDFNAAVAKVAGLANANAGWLETQPQAWVIRAHTIGRDAYTWLEMTPTCNAGWGSNGGAISANYVTRFTPQVQEQVGRAAVNLTAYLATILPAVPV